MARPEVYASEATAVTQSNDNRLNIDITPVIVAGSPNPGDPLQGDSPDLRIDPNLPTSPFAGVGSLEISAPGTGNFLCSGTAISPRHILTAAHCLDVVEEDGVVDVLPENVIFNINAQGENAAPIAITASALDIFDNGTDRYEGFSTSVSNDLAIVTLSEDLPAGIPIYNIARFPVVDKSIITLVGYGTSGNGIDGHVPGTSSPTVKRVGQNQVDDASLFSFLIPQIGEVFLYDFDGPDASTNTLSGLGSGLTLGNQIETTVGPGDSGGPSFIQIGDEWLLVGVNTFGFSFPKLEAPTTEVIQGTFGTGGGGVIVTNAEKRNWIESIVGDALGEGGAETLLGSLNGIVWDDLDGDGDRAPTEAPLAGATVYLDLNGNGLLDAAEPTTITNSQGSYTFSNLESDTYAVAVQIPAGRRQTAPQTGNRELFRADFSDGVAASLDGFTIDNSGGAVPGLWHLTTARGSQPGHSPPHSFYFGQNETATGGGNYDVGHTAGRITSPEISLVGLESAALTFNYFLNIEPDPAGDIPRVRITTDGSTFQTIASKGDILTVNSSQTQSWSTASLVLDDYIGSTIQLQFDFNTIDSQLNSLEGWFVDDVVVQGVGSDRHVVSLSTGQNISGLDFGLQTTVSIPPSAVIGVFDFEQFLRYYSDDSAAVPTTTFGGLPLAQIFDEGYYRRVHADVDAAIIAGNLTSGYDHFISFGLYEGRDPSLLYSEAFYRATNQDVVDAIANNGFRSGLEHFLNFGHKENRDPTAKFSQSDYLTQNPDVAAAVNAGFLQSAFEHYITYGLNEENRYIPANATHPLITPLYNEAFYLRTNPDVAAAVEQMGFRDGFEHFLRFGQRENRSPNADLDLNAYLAANPDVQNAVNNNPFGTAFAHYVQFGRFEDRNFG